MKKLLKCFCFSAVFILFACAPKPKVAPPPLFEETELSLEEIIVKAGKDIDVLKAIADIRIEKNEVPFGFVNAAILVKRPGWVHMRIYKMGMLVRDFVIKDGELYVLSGKGGKNLKNLGSEFYNAVFWWDHMRDGVMRSEKDNYIIRAENKEIYIERATLLPVKQIVSSSAARVEIAYDEPREQENGFWYQSEIQILAGEYKFKVKLKKLLRNPSLGELDFRIPVEG